jgi:DNA-binding transcriptional LysR family regulator
MKMIDLTRFDLNLLVVMNELMAERHVGRAAEKLHLSQSATSHALGRLRTALRDPLFIRNPKGIEPTPMAVELAPRIAALLREAEAIATPRGAFDPGRLARSFRVGATEHALIAALAPALDLIGAAAPQVVLHFESVDRSTVAALLDATSLDLAVCSASFTNLPHRIEAIPLFQERFVGIARRGHPALSRHGKRHFMSLDAFVDARHVLVSPSGEAAGPVDEVLARIGRRRQVAITIPTFMPAPFFVGAGHLVAVVAERVAQGLAASTEIVTFELPFDTAPWTVSILRAVGRAPEPEIAWLVECIVRSMQR